MLRPSMDEDNELRHSVKQIDCTKDNSEALLILLNICHSKFAKVPTLLETEQLYYVARLCNKYNCVDAVKLWLTESMWLSKAPKEPSENNDWEWWIPIADFLGLQLLFEKLVRHGAMTEDNEKSINDWEWLPQNTRGEHYIFQSEPPH